MEFEYLLGFCVSSKDSDHPRHPPGLIRAFAVHMKKRVLEKLEARYDWVDVHADLNLGWMKT